MGLNTVVFSKGAQWSDLKALSLSPSLLLGTGERECLEFVNDSYITLGLIWMFSI